MTLFLLLFTSLGLLSCKKEIQENDIKIVKELTGAKTVSISYDTSDTFVKVYESSMMKTERVLFSPILAVCIDEFMVKYRSIKNVEGGIHISYISNDTNVYEDIISNAEIEKINFLISKTKKINNGIDIQDYFLVENRSENIGFFKKSFLNSLRMDVYGFSLGNNTSNIYFSINKENQETFFYILSYDNMSKKIKSMVVDDGSGLIEE